MNKNVFKRIKTMEDLKGTIDTMLSMSEEQFTPKERLLHVDGTDLPNLTYMSSSSRGNLIKANYFLYGDDFKGLATCTVGSSDIIPLTSDDYQKCEPVTSSIWILWNKDTTFNMLIDGMVLDEHFEEYDVLTLGELRFLQLDKGDYRSLFCVWDSFGKGWYAPKSFEDFRDWFYKSVTKLGYEGRLDSCYVSDIFKVFFEVQNCIFTTALFKPLNI